MTIRAYEILQISPDATADQIRAAYLDQIKKWHPDHNGNSKESTEKTVSINLAYHILSDPIKRQRHDDYWKSVDNRTSASQAVGGMSGDLGALFQTFIAAMGPQPINAIDDDGQDKPEGRSFAQLIYDLTNAMERLNGALYGDDENMGLMEMIGGDDELCDQISANTDTIEDNTKIAKKALGVTDTSAPRKKRKR